jgi:hypothetical protein
MALDTDQYSDLIDKMREELSGKDLSYNDWDAFEAGQSELVEKYWESGLESLSAELDLEASNNSTQKYQIFLGMLFPKTEMKAAAPPPQAETTVEATPLQAEPVLVAGTTGIFDRNGKLLLGDYTTEVFKDAESGCYYTADNRWFADDGSEIELAGSATGIYTFKSKLFLEDYTTEVFKDAESGHYYDAAGKWFADDGSEIKLAGSATGIYTIKGKLFLEDYATEVWLDESGDYYSQDGSWWKSDGTKDETTDETTGETATGEAAAGEGPGDDEVELLLRVDALLAQLQELDMPEGIELSQGAWDLLALAADKGWVTLELTEDDPAQVEGAAEAGSEIAFTKA